jgi:cell division transport system permease protein
MSLPARIRYYARDAFDEWRHSPGVNVLATATLAAVLLVGGLFLLLLDNASARLAAFRADLRVEVYLEDDVDAARRSRLRSALENTAGVSRVEYVDKAQALERFRGWFPDLAAVPETLGENPLPESLEVYLAGDAAASDVAREIAHRWTGTTGIEEVRFDVEWLDRVEALLALVRIGSVVVGLVTFAVVIFVIASVLRLAVYARRDEIEIMMLVGATPGFVRGPFLFSGFVQGLVASGVALGIVELVRRAVLGYGATRGIALPVLLAGEPLVWPRATLLAAIGVAVSLAGAWFAVRRDVGAGLLR